MFEDVDDPGDVFSEEDESEGALEGFLTTDDDDDDDDDDDALFTSSSSSLPPPPPPPPRGEGKN